MRYHDANMISRRSSWLAARFALIGVALNALWPLLANADPRPQLPAVELCSMMGGGKVSVQYGDQEAGAPLVPAKLKPQHCVFCASGGCASAPADAARSANRLSAFSSVRPSAPAPVLSARSEFLLAAPRAPPSLPQI